MIDLATQYLGLKLKSPLVPSASPLTRDLDTPKRLEDAGAAAIVMDSLFEEQIVHDLRELAGAPHTPDPVAGPTPDEESRTAEYLERLYHLKEELAIPVIASLNCYTYGAWVRFAAMFEEAGADALELNIYFMAVDPDQTSAEVEERYVGIVKAVRESVHIPIAVKIGPYFTALANMARRFEAAGANGMVLFNRFFQPDIDLETLRVKPSPVLSTSLNCRLPLRWIAVLRDRVRMSLAASSGVHTGAEVAKLLLAGADVTQMATVLLQHGPEQLEAIQKQLEQWMELREYDSVDQVRGVVSYGSVADPGDFERAQYIHGLAHPELPPRARNANP